MFAINLYEKKKYYTYDVQQQYIPTVSTVIYHWFILYT